MPNDRRLTTGDIVYHVLNRAQGKKTLFFNNQDYQVFETILKEAKTKVSMRILAYCLMPNHWHMILYPRRDNDLSHFIHWLCTTHAKKTHAFRGTTGSGHLYQDRYKSFPVVTDAHFYQVCRYVERNALRAELVAKAQDWPWSSAYTRTQGHDNAGLLDEWPAEFPANYLEWLNLPQDNEVVENIRRTIQPLRGRPKKNP